MKHMLTLFSEIRSSYSGEDVSCSFLMMCDLVGGYRHFGGTLKMEAICSSRVLAVSS
jgi:hypothetical protein